MSLKKLMLPALGAALALAGLTSLAIGRSEAQTPPVATAASAQEAAVVAQVAVAAYQLDNAGLHALDEATAAGTIPSGALGRVRKARIVVAATSWPAGMQAAAREFVEHATRLEAALQAEDAARAAPDAHEVHEIGHDLSDEVYEWLAAKSGTSAGGDTHP